MEQNWKSISKKDLFESNQTKLKYIFNFRETQRTYHRNTEDTEANGICQNDAKGMLRALSALIKTISLRVCLRNLERNKANHGDGHRAIQK